MKLKIQGIRIPCFSKKKSVEVSSIYKINLPEDIDIPPLSKYIVPTRVDNAFFKDEVGVTEHI